MEMEVSNFLNVGFVYTFHVFENGLVNLFLCTRKLSNPIQDQIWYIPKRAECYYPQWLQIRKLLYINLYCLLCHWISCKK